MPDDIKNLTDEDWKKKLSPEQYRSLREGGTEVPHSGEHLYEDRDGMYVCVACKTPLFKSDAKYESTTPGLIGWPSFSKVAASEAIKLVEDTSFGMNRMEVLCSTCGGHLGHIFPDDTSPTGQHFCINSISLDFKPKS